MDVAQHTKLVSAFDRPHIHSKPSFVSNHQPFHSNQLCLFKRKPYLFIRSNLSNFDELRKLPQCTCFEFAFVRANPAYTNLDIDEEDFIRMALNSGAFRLIGETDLRYRLSEPGTKVFRDPWAKEAIKDFDLSWYYELKDKNKTPRPGRLWFSLLAYCFPKSKPPSGRDKRFWSSMDEAVHMVFKHFDPVDVRTAEDVIFRMPKNTSTGWLANFHFKKAMKKEEALDVIRREYYNMQGRISARKEVSDYVVFAMRGHLSERVKVKTRPVWLVSATTIISELKYYSGFYEQLVEKQFFRDRVITGKKSMSRLRDFLTKDPSLRLINTDISGWDSFRAAWFHERIMRRAKRLINFGNESQRLEYDFCINQAIRSKVLLPSGIIMQKCAGIISGTAGTLLFNTLLNMILSYTILIYMGVVDPFYGNNQIRYENWLGDDFAFYIWKDRTFDFDRFSALILKFFDLIINKEKTIFADNMDDRKYLGYQLKGGLLYRSTKELFQAVLYSERFLPFNKQNIAISFSRHFAYLLIGGINDEKYLKYFYYYLGKYHSRLEKIEYIFVDIKENVFKLLKDIWNIRISPFNIQTFQRMNLVLLKYVMFLDVELIDTDVFDA